MPSYLPKHRVVLTKDIFYDTIQNAKQLKKTQDKQDFDLEEVIEYITQYTNKLRRQDLLDNNEEMVTDKQLNKQNSDDSMAEYKA